MASRKQRAPKVRVTDFTPLTSRTVGAHNDANLRSQSRCYLQRLPAELRNRIYHYCCIYGGQSGRPLTDQPNLAHAFPQLAAEINSVFLGQSLMGGVVYFREKQSSHSFSGCGRLVLHGPTWIGSISAGSHTTVRRFHLYVRRLRDGLDREVQLTVKLGVHRKRVLCDTNEFRNGSRVFELVSRANAVIKQIMKRQGFAGYTLSDLESIAACFR